MVYKRPLGHPSKLTKMPRQELAALIQASPQASGYTSGWWNLPMIQDLMQRCFGVDYHPPSICTLLQNLDFSYQTARFVLDPLYEAQRREGCHPAGLRLYATPGGAKHCSCLAMKPVLPSGGP